MWRRVSYHIQTLVSLRSSSHNLHFRSCSGDSITIRAFAASSSSPFQKTVPRFSSKVVSDADTILSKGKKKVEDVMPIATGLEREELEAELEGEKRFDLDAPIGPFGTKEAPAIIKSYYDKRIVGCPGGEGEDEHDVVWFWLEKDKPHECPVCSQYFKLEVIGKGGPPEGYGDDDH